MKHVALLLALAVLVAGCPGPAELDAGRDVALVSDAMAGAGQADGVFPLGTQEATVVDGVARAWD